MFGPPKRVKPHTPRNRRAASSRVSSLSYRSPKGSAPSNIGVILRVRPHTPKEIELQYRDVIEILEDNFVIFDPKEDQDPFYVHGKKQKYRDVTKPTHKNLQFGFDKVYGPDANTVEVYTASIQELIESLLGGYNCSVFAYGATGSGKTYTMLGTLEAPGITPLFMRELYIMLENLQNTETDVTISYLEIYNEMVFDLLTDKKRPLQLREDGVTVLIADLTWHRPTDAANLMEMLQLGNEKRTQHPTDANAESSRSHAVFQVVLKMKRITLTARSGAIRCAKLAMIDLAGSERAAATTNSAKRFIEGANINKSLLALGNCINALADGLQHVPFRNSKLTRLLKGSLGGNCRTLMIANISPCCIFYEDTYNTLKYAARAKKIKTRVRKNQVCVGMSPAEFEQVMKQKQAENDALNKTVAEQEEQINHLRSMVTEAGLVILGEITSPSINQKVTNELQEHLELLLRAKTQLAMSTDTFSNLQANLEKLEARSIDKKAKLLRSKTLYPEDVKNESDKTIDLRNSAPKLNLEVQLKHASNDLQSKKDSLQQIIHQIESWAKQQGSGMIELLQTMHQLMSYHAQPDFVKCKVQNDCYKDIIKMRTKDYESSEKAFCLLADLHRNAHFALKSLNFYSSDMDLEFEQLRSMMRGQYSVSWRDQHSSSSSNDERYSEASSIDAVHDLPLVFVHHDIGDSEHRDKLT